MGIEDTFLKYFSGDQVNISFSCSQEKAERFFSLFFKGVQTFRDIPDLVITQDKSALIVEHFEFDCFKTRKGSKSREEQARIEREIRKKPLSTVLIPIHDKINSVPSLKYYWENVENNFKHHYSMIDTYKRNILSDGLITEGHSITTSFLIDDVSPLGAIAESDTGEPVPVLLAHYKPFLDLMSQSPDLDFVIATSTFLQQKFVYLISREDLPKYYEDILDYDSMRFLAHEPQVLGFSQIIKPSKNNDP